MLWKAICRRTRESFGPVAADNRPEAEHKFRVHYTGEAPIDIYPVEDEALPPLSRQAHYCLGSYGLEHVPMRVLGLGRALVLEDGSVGKVFVCKRCSTFYVVKVGEFAESAGEPNGSTGTSSTDSILFGAGAGGSVVASKEDSQRRPSGVPAHDDLQPEDLTKSG